MVSTVTSGSEQRGSAFRTTGADGQWKDKAAGKI